MCREGNIYREGLLQGGGGRRLVYGKWSLAKVLLGPNSVPGRGM